MSGGTVGRIVRVCIALAAIHSLLASRQAKHLVRQIAGPRYRYRRSPRPLAVQGCSAGTDTSHSWLPSPIGSSVNSCEHSWF